MPDTATALPSVRYGDQKRISVGVSLVDDYRCYEKPGSSKMLVHGWLEDPKEKEAFINHLHEDIRRYGRSWCWIEDCSVWDTRKEDQLPDEIFVVITASQTYDGNYSPTSWFGTEAYASKSEAEKSAGRETKNTWHWVLAAKRFKPQAS
jgi:hypothetical protein